MKKSVFVTGVPGVGKSTVSRKLNEKGYLAFGMETVGNLFSMRDIKTGELVTENFNDDVEAKKKSEWVCDPAELEKLISSQPDEAAFYCGTGSNNDEILRFFDEVILLVASSSEIRERLGKRQPGEFGNEIGIQDWVLSFKDSSEEHLKELGVIVVDASQPINAMVSDVIKISEQ